MFVVQKKLLPESSHEMIKFQSMCWFHQQPRTQNGTRQHEASFEDNDLQIECTRCSKIRQVYKFNICQY